MIYPINIKKKIKESRRLKENVRSVASVAAWLKDSIAAMTANQELTISRRILDSNFGFYVYWTQGFDINDDSVIHADADKSYGLVAALKCRNDAEWDGEYMDSPYDPKTGDLYCEDYELSPKDNTEMVAEWLLEDYNSMIELINNNPEIVIGGLKESKSVKESYDPEDCYTVWEVKDTSTGKTKRIHSYDKDPEDFSTWLDDDEIINQYADEDTVITRFVYDNGLLDTSDVIWPEDLDESKSIKEGMNWTNGEEEYEIDSTLASAPINSIIFIKKSYGGKNRTFKFEKVSTNKWDSLNKFNDRTSSYESDKSLKDKYIDGSTWKLEKAVNESKSLREAPDADGILYDYEVGVKYNDIANAEMKQNAEYRKKIRELKAEISKLVPEVQKIINILRESGETFYRVDLPYKGFGLRHSRAGAQICIDSKYGSNKLPKRSTYLTISQDDGSQDRIACSTTVTESGEILSDWDKGSWTNFNMRDPGYARVKALETFLDYFDAVKEKFYSEFNTAAESKSIKEGLSAKEVLEQAKKLLEK